MKIKIQPFRPTTQNLMLMESVLRQAIRSGYRNRHKGMFKKWNRDDVRDAIEAYRMIKITEGTFHVG